MTLHIRLATNSDERLWNEYVNAHPRATPYHRFGWLKSVEQAYQHKNIAAIALNDTQIEVYCPVFKCNGHCYAPHFAPFPTAI